MKNKLFYGDNLTVMKDMMPSSVDLIYLDPPFNSNRNYNMMYKTMTGKPVPEQAEAFCDAWTLDAEDIEKLKKLPILMQEYDMDSSMVDFWVNWMKALKNTNSALLSYLFYMMQRLFEMRRILKPTGSIYLHCDPTASHYIKVMMDGVFGHNNFRNEIIWRRYAVHSLSTAQFDTNTDTILFYSKSDKNYFNQVLGKVNNIEKKFKYTEKETGRKYQHVALEQTSNSSSKDEIRIIQSKEIKGTIGWRWSQETFDKRLKTNPHLIYWTKTGRPRYKIYADEYAGTPLGNNWTDINALSSNDNRRFGYPTQKPPELLERIIQASCPAGGIVFDPFAGCGTTIYASEKLGRKWIGCDIAVLSTKLIKDTLTNGKPPLVIKPLEEGVDFELVGYPISTEGAKLLFTEDPKQFEHWAIEWVGGFINQKQSGDRGVDGRIYFETVTGSQNELEKMVISVKGGKHINPSMVRDIIGTMNNEDAKIAGLILIEKPTRGMLEAATQAGQYEYNGSKYDRMQILTVEQMTEEKKLFHIPNKIGHKYKDRQGRLYI